jgi:predicted short-subunit dehydrogenase-like oxidoreductase (DUF2520 family)
MKAVIIGSGNVATHLALAFQKKGIIISQVYSRTLANAELLAKKLNTSFTTHTSGIDRNADIYIYALKDSSFLNLLKRFDLPKAIHVHTSGSIPMKDFYGYAERYGVLYPLQTFSINKEIDFSNVPICIEANSERLENELIQLANLLTTKTYILTSEQRRKVHLAAVFACNFTNYMYDIAHDIVLGAGIEFDILKPLIMETADKINTLSPREAQTGPAIRYDENIINKHLMMLDNRKNWKAIYKRLTKNIHNRHARKKNEGFFKQSANLLLRKVRFIIAKFRKQ